MYNDVPMPEGSSYYDELKEKIGEDCCSQLNPILDGLTVKQLNQVADYVRECARRMSQHFEKNVTMEDYEKAKKIDIDEDNEEGESE